MLDSCAVLRLSKVVPLCLPRATMTQLKTRHVFVDTSMYEGKNFQFNSHALGRFAELCENRSINLLMTSITEREIRSHLLIKANDAAKSISGFKKEIKILRNLPDIPHYGIFDQLKSEDINASLLEIFDEFLDVSVNEYVDLSMASIEQVVDGYFNATPPFSAKKKDEFPDAIVLHAIEAWAKNCNTSVYILSTDGDMQGFSNNSQNTLIYESDLEHFISLVVKNDKAHQEPIKFAENRCTEIWWKIAPLLEEDLGDLEFSGSYGEIDEWEISNIDYKAANVQQAYRDSSEFSIKVKFDVEAWHIIDDYDRSIWDPEDKKYLFLAQNRIKVRNTVECDAIVNLEYEDGLEVNTEITDSYIEDNYVELDIDDGIELDSYMFKDMN